MIKEIFLAILLVIVSLTNVYTVERNDRVRADSDRNPKKIQFGLQELVYPRIQTPCLDH